MSKKELAALSAAVLTEVKHGEKVQRKYNPDYVQPIWLARAAIAARQPQQLQQWAVYEVTIPGAPGRTRYLTGCEARADAFVSHLLVEFDAVAKAVTDAAGARYSIAAPLRVISFGKSHEWQVWCSMNAAEAIKDVSDEYVSKQL